jgi:thiamine biosynthesis lipoprotein
MRFKVLIIPLFLLFIFQGCKEKKIEFGTIAGFAQGSTYSIVFGDTSKFNSEDIRNFVEKIFHDIDISLSVYNDSSLISRINRNEDPPLDAFFMEVFKRSGDIYFLTDGAFDITVGPLVRMWGFGPDGHKNYDRSKLDSIMRLIGFEKVTIKNNHIVKTEPGINIDVNAIAQGYTADVICKYFTGLGMKNFLIEIGGEVRVKGDKNGEYWKIGIDRPEDNNMSPGNNLSAVIKIKDRALATSGNYRKFYVEEGVKYSHTINPKTGFPAKNNLLSATIIADDCATADAIATACMVMGKDKSIEFLNNNPDLEAYLIYSGEDGSFKTWMTKNLENYLMIIN